MSNLNLNQIAEVYHSMADEFLDEGDIHRALGALQNGYRLSMDPEFLLRQLDLYIGYNAFPQALDLCFPLLENPGVPPEEIAGSLAEIYTAMYNNEAAAYWRNLYTAPEIERPEQAAEFLRAELRKLDNRHRPPEGWHLVKPVSPQEESRRLEQVRRLLKHGQIEPALEILDSIPRLSPNVSDVCSLRAIAALASSNPREADRILRSCPEPARKSVQFLTTQCTVARILGDKRRLASLLSELDRLKVSFPYEEYKIALCLAENSRFVRATEHMLNFLDYAPFDREGLLSLGLIYLNRGKMSEARLCFYDLYRAGGGVPARAWLVFTDHLLAEGVKRFRTPCRLTSLPEYYARQMEARFREAIALPRDEAAKKLSDCASELLDYIAYSAPPKLFTLLHYYDSLGLPACLMVSHLLTDTEVKLTARIEAAQYMIFTHKPRFTLILDSRYYSLRVLYPKNFEKLPVLFRRSYTMAYMSLFLFGKGQEGLQRAADEMVRCGPPPEVDPLSLAAYMLRRSSAYGEDADELFELYQASEETLGRLIAVYGPLPGKPDGSEVS